MALKSSLTTSFTCECLEDGSRVSMKMPRLLWGKHVKSQNKKHSKLSSSTVSSVRVFGVFLCIL